MLYIQLPESIGSVLPRPPALPFAGQPGGPQAAHAKGSRKKGLVSIVSYYCLKEHALASSVDVIVNK